MKITSKKPRFFSNKLKQKPIPQKENIQSHLSPNIHSLKQKLLTGNGFVVND